MPTTTETTTETVKTSALRQGDVVQVHGMRVLLDQPIRQAAHPEPEPVFYCRGKVLNLDDVKRDQHVPLAWLHRDRGEARWTIQGNDLARWTVER